MNNSIPIMSLEECSESAQDKWTNSQCIGQNVVLHVYSNVLIPLLQ